MEMTLEKPGHLMAKESAEALGVFAKAATQNVALPTGWAPKAIYTVARGSSDAAANILSYEFMRELGVPMTSLPPSVFSLGGGVMMAEAAALVISQSGASDDLVRSAHGAARNGARVMAITNQPHSAVEAAADVTVPIGAGPELAVPATKSVIGSVAAGMALLHAIKPEYDPALSAAALADLTPDHAKLTALRSALHAAKHVYVIGRDTGFGAAHEVALKLKECCALHAEAYSSSEVLHGPLQLATKPLMVLILDTCTDATQASLNEAQTRFEAVGCDVHRIRVADFTNADITPAAAAALLLAALYPVILDAALAMGMDPDAPETLSKVTKTT